MSKSAQSGRYVPAPGKTARPRRSGLLYLLLAVVLMLVAASFYWLSRKKADNERTARPRQESPLSAAPAQPVATDTAPEANDEVDALAEADPADAAQAMRASYRVRSARAYFYAAPAEDKSTGKYVLRDDIIYAEAESGDFIRTRYFNASGDPVAGWLRKTDVQLLKRNLASTTPSRPKPTRAAPAPEAKTPPSKASATSSAATAQNLPPSATQPTAATGVVRVDTTYFYDSPDLTQRRRAFCIRGDKLRLSESSEEAVFATFVNWEKVRTTGWIRKEDLRIQK